MVSKTSDVESITFLIRM